MHGIICKAVEFFVLTRHGEEAWQRVIETAGLGFDRFETVQIYEARTLERTIGAAAIVLKTTPVGLMEDIGTWICTHPPLEPIRRLFRFCGPTFEEMLYGLEEVPERSRLAMPDLDLPELNLIELGDGRFEVVARWAHPGTGAVLLGVLRAMADDYGALAFLEPVQFEQEGDIWVEKIMVSVLDESFAAPREFRLGGAA